MFIMLQIQVPSLPLFTSLVILVTLIICWKRFISPTVRVPILRLPPGPWKLPLIGNLHNLTGSLRHSLRDLAKKHGPIMHLKLGQVSAIAISSPELAKQVLKTHETAAFSQRPTVLAVEVLSYNFLGIITSPYNEYWRQMRKICVLELLSAKRVQSFSSIREEEAWNLVESISLSQGQPINLSEMIFSMQDSIIARSALGKKCKYQQEFRSLIKEAFILGEGFSLPDLFPSLKFLRHVTRTKSALEKIHRKIDRILDEIIDDHHELKRVNTNIVASITTRTDEVLQEGPVHVLLQLQESGGLQFDLTTNHIKAVILDMYLAGAETSATTTEWAIAELVKNPRAMEKAQAEVRHLLAGKRKSIQEEDIKKLDYLKLVIKETLRLHPPVPLIPREATQRIKIGGYDIPTEAKVLINAWEIGRDPKHWDNADCFLPERFQGSSIDFRGTNFELIPFGAGKRICPGISFGIASVELALSQLLYYFNWQLPNGKKVEELDMTESLGMTSRRRNDLYVIATPFVPS
ncbi:premnaspirodiene oxygenase-like [Prunus avium]|uniref:Premnaspirodiene oxygenase-like n=1 Tax=Prunus avium TaxID=42229 RepID=A0A6P5RU97_PRUAV|nr:premnaspirodiene oxygenase-like [Prunus avium]